MRSLVLFFLILSFSKAQITDWWIYFDNKDCNPQISLSQNSIQKRLSKKIKFDIHDLSICQNYLDTLKQHNIKIRHQSRWLNAVSVSVNNKDDLLEIINYSFVKKIMPLNKFINQKKLTKYDCDVTLDASFRQSESLPYGTSYNQINMLGGIELHNSGYLGNNIVIAVFDAGFNGVEELPLFHHLWENEKILETFDFVDNDDNVFNGSSHGTMVLSAMAGFMPDSLIGSAPEASYMLFRTEDSKSETLIEEDYWAAAAEYADSVGVDIINSSLGYTILYDDMINSHSYLDMDGNTTIITNAADFAASKGILVVNSAGNSGNSDWYYIGAPADGDSVLAVGAVNSSGDVASFSSRGPTVDGRIKPNVCAQGVYTVVADLDSTIRVANGTSFSAPLIAGLAACLWESKPTLNNIQLLNLIEESSHLFDSPNDSIGYGIPNFYNAYLNSLEISSNYNFLSIYPNPFVDNFYISHDFNYDFEIEILNSLGQLIFQKKIYQNQSLVIIDELEKHKPGFYFVKHHNSNYSNLILKLSEK
tara:strand:- start:15090 stop:16688 length:1599 start_codon:yes stop_codon:yes gene_type:complete